MWARIEDGKIVQTFSTPKSLTINSVQYPVSIFTTAWTDAERKAIGIVPYVYEGSLVDNMFYSTSESAPSVQEDKVVVTRTKKERDVAKIKEAMQSHVSSTLSNYLEQTDWIVIREQDNGTAKPADFSKWRTDLRAKAVALEAAIDGKSNVASLEAMTVFTVEMADAGKKAAEFNDWPQNPRHPDV